MPTPTFRARLSTMADNHPSNNAALGRMTDGTSIATIHSRDDGNFGTLETIDAKRRELV